MKLTKKAIKAMTTKAKTRIALEFNCSAYTVERWIKDNEPNGDLTKSKAVEIISEETELEVSEILEAEKVGAQGVSK